MLLVLAMSTMLVLGISGVCAAAPSGSTMSNELESQITAEDVSGVQLGIEHQTDLVLGMYDEFGLYIDNLGDHAAGESVRGRVKLVSGPDGVDSADIELRYLGQTEGNDEYGGFHELDGDVTAGWAYFGSPNGFPLPETIPYGPSIFRLKVADDAPTGTYQFQVEMVTADAEEAIVSEPLDVFFVVTDDNAVSLSGTGILGEETTTVTVGVEETGSVTAELTDSVNHLDHAVHVIDVEKETGNNGWEAAGTDDFTVSEPGEGFCDTFEISDGVLRGWWGPETGFLLADSATTSFNVTFDVAGTYRVKVYTIQTSPGDYGPDKMTGDLPDYWEQYVLLQ